MNIEQLETLLDNLFKFAFSDYKNNNELEFNKEKNFTKFLILSYGPSKILKEFGYPFLRQPIKNKNKFRWINNFKPEMLCNFVWFNLYILNDEFYFKILFVESKFKNSIFWLFYISFGEKIDITVDKILETKNSIIESNKQQEFNEFIRKNKNYKNEISLDEFINNFTFHQIIDFFSYLNKDSKIFIVENFFPLVIKGINNNISNVTDKEKIDYFLTKINIIKKFRNSAMHINSFFNMYLKITNKENSDANNNSFFDIVLSLLELNYYLHMELKRDVEDYFKYIIKIFDKYNIWENTSANKKIIHIFGIDKFRETVEHIDNFLEKYK